MVTGCLRGFIGATLLATHLCAGGPLPTLTTVADIPLPGHASRFDYQSFDPKTKTLYVAHMGDGELVVFDAAARKVVAHLPGFPSVTGVLVVPELQRVFVSAPGNHEVAVDSDTHEVYLPLKNVDGRPMLRIMKPAPP